MNEDGRIIGYYSIALQENRACELNNLCVLPEHRHKRVGERLLNDAFDRARALDCTKIDFSPLHAGIWKKIFLRASAAIPSVQHSRKITLCEPVCAYEKVRHARVSPHNDIRPFAAAFTETAVKLKQQNIACAVFLVAWANVLLGKIRKTADSCVPHKSHHRAVHPPDGYLFSHLCSPTSLQHRRQTTRCSFPRQPRQNGNPRVRLHSDAAPPP